MVQQGQAAGYAALDANSRTNQLMMEKVFGGYGLNAPEFYQHARGDIANETDVVKQNFGAKMAEENIRGQLHQQYMNMMWRQLKYQRRAMQMQEIGAVLGVTGGLIGGAMKSKPVSEMNTEELGEKGLLDPSTGMLKDEGYQPTPRPATLTFGERLGKGLSASGQTLWDRNDPRQYQVPLLR